MHYCYFKHYHYLLLILPVFYIAAICDPCRKASAKANVQSSHEDVEQATADTDMMSGCEEEPSTSQSTPSRQVHFDGMENLEVHKKLFMVFDNFIYSLSCNVIAIYICVSQNQTIIVDIFSSQSYIT